MSGKAEGWARAAPGPPASFTGTLLGLQTAIWWAATSMHLDGADWSVTMIDGRWWAVREGKR